VQRITPTPGEYIFVYLSIPHFDTLLEILSQQPRPVIVYGQQNQLLKIKNVTFKPYHQEEILRDLAGSYYAVVNGGHNLICEALYYQKPVLCFPIAGLLEQYINVSHIRSLNYGDYTYDTAPPLELFCQFEAKMSQYQQSIRENYRDGTDQLVTRLREIIQEGT
jgi:uncharacterized protein (TIGR00661 family)